VLGGGIGGSGSVLLGQGISFAYRIKGGGWVGRGDGLIRLSRLGWSLRAWAMGVVLKAWVCERMDG
jgi:hypothetical protein